jgi:hypothetical protein
VREHATAPRRAPRDPLGVRARRAGHLDALARAQREALVALAERTPPIRTAPLASSGARAPRESAGARPGTRRAADRLGGATSSDSPATLHRGAV